MAVVVPRIGAIRTDAGAGQATCSPPVGLGAAH